MKKQFIIMASLLSTACITQPSLKIMTYNIRRMGSDPVEFQWDNRKNLVFNEVLSRKPAIVGFQEVVKGQQYDDLKQALSEHYRSFGEDRNKFAKGPWQKWVITLEKAKNECSPIFYDPNKVELIKSGTMGINPVGYISRATLPRICTWGLFKDKQTNTDFYVYNTHLSTSSLGGLKDGTELIRNKQVKMILKHNKKVNKNFPVLIMGDFNTKIEGKIKKIFYKKGFKHAREIAKVARGPFETRTGWNDNELKEIDHILVKNMNVAEYQVIANKENTYPSDHRPVMANILLE